MIALLDCDGVLCDFVTGVLQRIDNPPERWSMDGGTHLFDHFTEKQKLQAEKELTVHRLCLEMPQVPGAKSAVQELRRCGYEIHVVTTPWPTSVTWCYDRTLWLGMNFGIPKENIHFSYDKRLFTGKLLVEDRKETLVKWMSYANDRAGRAFYHCQNTHPWFQVLMEIRWAGLLLG